MGQGTGSVLMCTSTSDTDGMAFSTRHRTCTRPRFSGQGLRGSALGVTWPEVQGSLQGGSLDRRAPASRTSPQWAQLLPLASALQLDLWTCRSLTCSVTCCAADAEIWLSIRILTSTCVPAEDTNKVH